jgi:hypothetical protein
MLWMCVRLFGNGHWLVAAVYVLSLALAITQAVRPLLCIMNACHACDDLHALFLCLIMSELTLAGLLVRKMIWKRPHHIWIDRAQV